MRSRVEQHWDASSGDDPHGLRCPWTRTLERQHAELTAVRVEEFLVGPTEPSAPAWESPPRSQVMRTPSQYCPMSIARGPCCPF